MSAHARHLFFRTVLEIEFQDQIMCFPGFKLVFPWAVKNQIYRTSDVFFFLSLIMLNWGDYRPS